MFKVPNRFRIGEAIQVKPGHPYYENMERLKRRSSEPNEGGFFLPRPGKTTGLYFLCIASCGMGWEHVSITVAGEKRTPTWEEMCYVKAMFWDADDAVMQLHPPKKDWVNEHPYCLHLWRPTGSAQIPLPPAIMVGLRQANTNTNNTAL